MAGIATATGGTFTEFSCSDSTTCNVDLSTLPIASSITGGLVYLCDGTTSTFTGDGNFTFVIEVSVVGSDGETYTSTVTFVLTLAF